jgi:hypothetical protein
MSRKLITMSATGMQTPLRGIPEAGPVSEVIKNIGRQMLQYELGRAIEDLGPAEAAQVVVRVFRLKGLPKELRRHL